MALGSCEWVHLTVTYSLGKFKHIFWHINVLFAVAQQTSTAKLVAFFLNFKNRERRLNVNETKHHTKNASNWDNFGFGVNNTWTCDEMALFGVSLYNLDLYINSKTTDNVGLPSWAKVWFVRIFCHFLWLWETGNRFIQLWINFWVKLSILKLVQRNHQSFL